MRMHPSPRTSPDSAESALRAGTTRRDSPSPRTSSGSPSIDDVGNGADSVPEPHVQDVSTHGVEVSDRGPPPPPGGRKCSLQGLSGGLAANGSKTPSYMGHAPPVPLDGGKDAVSHPRPATRASSWYTGAHTNDARTEEPGPPDGTRNRSARFGLPVGIGRRICARQSSSGTLGATGAVTVPPESHFLRVSHSPTEPRPVLPVLAVGACLLFIVMVVTIVIFVLLPGRPGMAPNVCSTIECLVYGEQLASSIDSSMPPCHNFTHFVCGGWRRDHRLGVREELSERVMERMTRLVRAIAVPATYQNSVQAGGGRLPQLRQRAAR
ncbi:hypothetical protein MRX96_021447 [Rhipicephalus microplus]